MRRALQVMLVGAVACSSSGQTLVSPDLPVDSAVEAEADAAPRADLGPETPATPEVQDLLADAGEAEAAGPACAAGSGCFLDPCAENPQCASGWCVDHMGDGVCTVLCQEECPAGWGCKQVQGEGPDVSYICVSMYANLCRPCEEDTDCKGAGGAEDVCVYYGPQGSFCGGACVKDEECPWGFSCEASVSVDGGQTKQCVAAAGECPCTGKSEALALSTSCVVTNEVGTCKGYRRCGADGLSACDAAEPMLETCNGTDDDCDGETDEPLLVDGDYVNLCDDDNDCTQDQCLAADGCLNSVLDFGTCDDGDPCSVADHCAAGACVGDPVQCEDENPCTDNLCTVTGGCTYPPIPAECDDGDPCTLGDHCASGICVGEAVPCDCLADDDCAQLDDGDTCNGKLFCNTAAVPFHCEVKPNTVVTCPDPSGPDAPCLASACDPASGICAFVPAHEGAPCEDGNACTVSETCAAGKCGGGQPANCNDGNPCTSDACAPAAGCTHADNQLPCSDNDVCTTADHCAAGACAGGAPLDCEDGNPCTLDGCDKTIGCKHVQSVGAACDDGNACTAKDVCGEQGSCQGLLPVGCDDDNVCTTDSCDPAQGCVYALNKAPCTDDDVCTLGDHCHLGACISSQQLICNDSNPCTDDACSPTAGCQFMANKLPCDDANACTVGDLCAAAWCKPGKLLSCDDANPCTTDSCDPAVGCLHVANPVVCEDGNACTAGDVCKQGACVPGPLVNCDDGNLCTTDSCDAAAGCLHADNALACDDGNECTTGDACAKGACKGTGALSCDDASACTSDACLPATGCSHLPLTGTPCTDSSVCTNGDLCQSGACVPGPALPCNDGSQCTTDSCDPATGCTHVPIVPCCGNGNVEAGEQCDDGNLVSGDGCEPNCTLVTKLKPGDTTAVVERQGFKIQCKQWSGNTCTQVWFSVPAAAITTPAPCGVDDKTSLRPVWHGDASIQCKTLCWIATGDNTCVSSSTSSNSGTASGWMYTGSPVSCDSDGRQYSEIDVPTVGKQIWSFDKMTWQRNGNFSSYQCKW